jgi:hypothetical protein
VYFKKITIITESTVKQIISKSNIKEEKLQIIVYLKIEQIDNRLKVSSFKSNLRINNMQKRRTLIFRNKYC